MKPQPTIDVPKWSFSPRQMLSMFWWNNPTFSHCSGIIADGAVRSGKTISLGFGFLMWSMTSFNNQQFGLCGKTIKSFERNVLSPMRQMCKSLGYIIHEKKADNMMIVSDPRNGHSNTYYLFGGNDESSQDLIQGVTLAGIILDEVVLMPESFVNQALARCSVTGSKVWMNCNPEGAMHYVKRRFIDQYNRLKYLYVHFTMDDNLTLSDERRKFYSRQYTGLFYRRYILGEWCLASGLVFSAFNAETMVYEEDDDADCYTASFCSGDYGTTNPTAFLYTSYNYMRDCFDVRDEYYYNSRETEVQKTDDQYVEDITDFVKGREVQRAFLDPAAASLMVALRQAHTFPRLEAANNDVLSGIKWTNMLFAMGKIRINARCKNLIKELGIYAWDDEKSEKTGQDVVLKVSDHACVSGDTLIRTDRGDVPIRDLVGKEGKALSYNTEDGNLEWKTFRDVCMTKKRALVYRIQLVDGRTIDATEDHPILTERGYVRVSDLTMKDAIKTIDSFCRLDSICKMWEEPVYNMTVEDNHNYFGNGVCTHNCDALRYFAYTETYGRRRLYGLQNLASVVDD